MPRNSAKNRRTAERVVAAACRSFPPVAADNPRALILGSMPGVKSLAAGEYYAHPQNAFGKILSTLFDMPAGDYAQRLRIITENNLALWDVLKYCEREGSLDSAIDGTSIEVNDFAALLTQHKNIRRVFLNGGKAAQEFKRRVLPDLPREITARLKITQLPSTSPAHAGMTFADKAAAWSIISDFEVLK
ncbi:MAG TPA: DNA-deoxyinosine glycosylase [Alphaproteobacteria bacterium]|nr:DNA-deoxyinosine glycosylase [Alphaproteobacteria bacterium]